MAINKGFNCSMSKLLCFRCVGKGHFPFLFLPYRPMHALVYLKVTGRCPFVLRLCCYDYKLSLAIVKTT